jgi:predicted permease
MLRRVMQFLRRSRLDEGMEDEFRFHLEMEAEALEKQGLPRAEALRRARLQFGGMEGIKEETREARGLVYLERIAQDLRYAARTLRKSPLFVLSAGVTLALGIGLNMALFNLLYALVLRPLPVADPQRMVNIHMTTRGDGPRGTYGNQYMVSHAEFLSMRAQARTADVAGAAGAALTWQGSSDRLLRGLLVSGNLLPMIGARPALGRFFTETECARPGGDPVAVLQHSFWKSKFGSDPGVIGRTITLNRTPFTVVGVTAEEVKGPVIETPEIWIPLTMQAVAQPGEPLIDNPNMGWIQLFGRMRSGVSRHDVQAEMEVLGQRALAGHGSTRTAVVTVMPGGLFNFPFVFRNGAMPAALLMTAVMLVLLLACANVANILLARGLSRAREMALRLAIGAGRGRVLQQLLTESVVLALAAGAGGMVLALWGGSLLLRVLEPQTGPTSLNTTPDGVVLAAGLLVTLVTAALFGLAPALQALKADLTPALKSEGAISASPSRRRWLQPSLVGLQVAICAVLLVNAALLLRGLRNAAGLDVGRARTGIQVVTTDLRQQLYTPERARLFYSDVVSGLAAVPGIESAALSSLTPYVQSCMTMVSLTGSKEDSQNEHRVECFNVGDHYLETVGVRLLAGRDFLPSEMGGEARVALVDEDFARRYLNGRDPIGQLVRTGFREKEDVEIVGVVSAVRGLEPGRESAPGLYQPIQGRSLLDARIMVRTRLDGADFRRKLEQVVRRADANVRSTAKPIEHFADEALLAPRLATSFAIALGVLALVLACCGIYGVIAFTVARRTREVGIRMALGASRSEVLALLMRQGMRPVATGLILGCAAALGLAQLMRAMLYGVSPVDPLSLPFVVALLASVAMVAGWLPARRATLIDPSRALREE